MHKKILSLTRNLLMLAGVVFCLNMYSLNAQIYDSFTVNLKWHEADTAVINGDSIICASFDNAVYNGVSEIMTPYFEKIIPVYSSDLKADFIVTPIMTELVPLNELSLITNDIDSKIKFSANIIASREDYNIYFSMLPFIKTDKGIERIVTFEASYTLINLQATKSNVDFADNSVLSTGKWYKMALSSTGIYKITYSDLEAMGINVSSIDPHNIRIYHNGGGIVPKLNSEERYDDLVEIPIFVSGENDNVFNQGDYILFYGRGPIVWNYTGEIYEHERNPYSDLSYAFLTVDLGTGKRIESFASPTQAPSYNVTNFLDYQHKEENLYNLNNMGATWYYDLFDITLSRDYSFSFPNIVTNKAAIMKAEVASRNTSSASFRFTINNNLVSQLQFSKIVEYVYANTGNTNLVDFMPTSSSFAVKLNYSRTASSSTGWLDYITINAWRELVFTGGVMSFRNPECDNISQVYQYQMRNANNSIQIWNVTNPVTPQRITTQLSSSTMSFNVVGGQDNEFIAFDGSSFKSVSYAGVVANQNLHAKKNIDYLIITHPDFMSQAERLKMIHNQIDDLEIDIVTPQAIYNEFSCGALDIAAIRDYIRMLYQKGDAGHKIQYVLLLGDASYDYRNTDGKVCLIPTYESVASCSLSLSFVTDDFFVCLDDDEGNMENNTSIIDVAIGRMPVNTLAEATYAVDKVEAYVKKGGDNMNIWRNKFSFIADDGDKNFAKYNEFLIDTIRRNGGDMDVNKIYLDAYEQIATSSGQRCPEANEAITNTIEKGTLIVNYIGHGGEVGLADERILTNADIKSWRNSPMMPLFVTATCEFSRFDDHTRTSAGELVFLNQYGGAIAMITTARVTYGSSNYMLLLRLYRKMFNIQGGEYPTMGEMFLAAKNNSNKNTKVFVFFGDPALRLAYPKYNVELSSINGINVNQKLDTLKALKRITMEGVVKDFDNEVMTDFNGIAYVSVFDKENNITTNGDGTEQITFNVRNNMIYNGKTIVENGRFSIDFTVPKDIQYNYGNGRVSFYATNYETDAHGFFSDFIVGGYDETAIPDVDAPEVNIFIDDTLFVDGGITDENPVFYAYIKDENGINTSGAGIGHDLMAVLSGATNKSYNLNQYYEAPLDNDDWGSLVYRFYNLDEGDYNLRFRVWDIYNNSTTVSLNFTVIKGENFALDNLYNYPNPMADKTSFVFDCNQNNNEINVTVNIYNISGQLVKTISEQRFGSSIRMNPIIWDGKSDGGSLLPSGLYIYNVIITNNSNEKASDFSKLVISRN